VLGGFHHIYGLLSDISVFCALHLAHHLDHVLLRYTGPSILKRKPKAKAPSIKHEDGDDNSCGQSGAASGGLIKGRSHVACHARRLFGAQLVGF
jgi:hypothetical protein